VEWDIRPLRRIPIPKLYRLFVAFPFIKVVTTVEALAGLPPHPNFITPGAVGGKK
jgi:hypothetical protein